MSNADDEIDDDITADELIEAVFNGEVNVADLTDEEQEIVFEGYKKLVKILSKNPEHAEVAGKMQELLNMAEDDSDEEADPFEDAIDEAVERGSTYFELENDISH